MSGLHKSFQKSFYHIAVTIFAIIMIYPVLWMIFSSFKDNQSIFGTASLIPKQFRFDNFVRGWQGVGGVPFGIFFKNSFYYVILSTIGTVISSAIVAYGFARIKFAGKKIWFACMMMTMMLPIQVVMIPQFILFFKLGWTNTFLPLIVPMFTGVPFFIFLMIQFIRGLPIELDESAKIDGCSTFGIYWRIMLPMIKPALIAVTVLHFIGTWNDFQNPLIYLKSMEKMTVSVGLNMFRSDYANDWNLAMGASLISLLPGVVIYFLAQRYLVQGIVVSGIKG